MKRLFSVDKRPKDFDIIIIGSSLEGLACAKAAANVGASVCVVAESFDIEEQLLEREFFNLLYNAGKSRTKLKEAYEYGWSLGRCPFKSVSLQRLDKAKKSLKDSCTNRFNEFMDESTICYLQGNFKFVSIKPITIASNAALEDQYTAEYFVLAPMGFYVFPDVRGASNYGLLPKDLLKLECIDGQVLVVGDGSDALELASAFLQMGLSTTILDKNGRTPCFDNQMLTFYLESLADQGLKIKTKTIITLLEKSGDSRILVHYTTLSNKWRGCDTYDFVIFVGERRTNLKPFRLNNLKMETEWDKIPTNCKFESNISKIYVLGSALDRQTHNSAVDIQIGKNLANFLFHDHTAKGSLRFTDVVGLLRGPTVDYAFVGMTEEGATKMYGSKYIEVYHTFYKPIEYFIAKKKMDQCYLKIICMNDKSGRIIGMHLLGPNSAAILQGYVVALKSGMTYNTLIKTIGVFPSVSREFTLLTITKRSGQNPKSKPCCS